MNLGQLLDGKAGVEPGAGTASIWSPSQACRVIRMVGSLGTTEPPLVRIDPDLECGQHPDRGMRGPQPGRDIGPGPGLHRIRHRAQRFE